MKRVEDDGIRTRFGGVARAAETSCPLPLPGSVIHAYNVWSALYCPHLLDLRARGSALP
jgi:hypothetical protein